MEEEKPSFTPINNPLGVTQFQREELEKWIDEGIVHGTKEGIDYLTREEANVMIVKARQRVAGRWTNSEKKM